jgi:ATP synthase I chain
LTLRNASLQTKHACLLVLAIAGAIPYGCLAVWSLALAGGIQVLNLAVLERSVRLVVAENGSAPAARVFFMLRLFLVFGAIAAALGLFGARPLPFVAGLSVVVPAVIWHGLSTAHGR